LHILSFFPDPTHFANGGRWKAFATAGAVVLSPQDRYGTIDSGGGGFAAALIGEYDASSTSDRREAFLSAVEPMIALFERAGLKFYPCKGHRDYCDDLPGGRSRGRATGAQMIPASKLGADRGLVLLLPGWSLPIATDEFVTMSLVARTLRGRVMADRVALRSVRQ
jgi:hypothetical protein